MNSAQSHEEFVLNESKNQVSEDLHNKFLRGAVGTDADGYVPFKKRSEKDIFNHPLLNVQPSTSATICQVLLNFSFFKIYFDIY